MVRQVVRFYIDIQYFHIARTWNAEQKGASVRQTTTKLVLFKNQEPSLLKFFLMTVAINISPLYAY